MSDLVLATNDGGGWYTLPNGEQIRGKSAVMAYYQGLDTENAEDSWAKTRVNRMRFARKAGLQYGNARDVYTVAGYIPEGDLGFDHYWSRYERQGIAGRIVDMPPQAMWRESPEIVESGKEDGTEFTEAFVDLADRLRLWHRFERADRLARIGRFGVLLIGAADGDDSELKEPLGQMKGPEDVLYLSAFHEGDSKIERWETDPRNERFGHASLYKLKLSDGVEGFPTDDILVHHSRIVHIAEDLLADEVFGRPALKRAINLLMDLEKITAATAEAYWQLADKILMLSVDPTLEMGQDDRDALGEAAEEMMHDLRRQMVGQGIEASWHGGDTPDPSGAADLYMMLLAASSGIPKRILFGTETGERASQQDERQWHGTIKDRETTYGEPVILRPFVDRMIEHGALPGPTTGEYEVQWPNRFQLDEVQEADLNLKRAETAKTLTPMGGDPLEVVVIDDEGNIVLRSSEDIEESRPDPVDVTPPEPGSDDEDDDESDGEDEV